VKDEARLFVSTQNKSDYAENFALIPRLSHSNHSGLTSNHPGCAFAQLPSTAYLACLTL
jgi:hypothetical protein